MKYGIIIEARAQREIKTLPQRDRERVERAISALSVNPLPPGAKPLHGKSKGLCRIRVGDYRVIYQVRQTELIIAVVRVGQRGNVYRGL